MDKKKPGIIRSQVVFPTLIFVAAVWAYFFFLFDGHLRRGSEYVATQVHGAEVNIARISTSVFGASLEVNGIQVTDKSMPTHNMVEVGTIKFKALWDALLRMKFVIEDASVLDIRAQTKRAKPGYVLPPPPPSDSSALARVQEEVVSQTKKKLEGNFFGTLVETLEGADPKDQLKNLQGEIQSALRAKELKLEIETKRKAWEERIKNLPRPADLKPLEDRMKALDFKSKNPIDIAKNLKEAKKIVEEAEGKVKEVDQSQKDLRSDMTNFTNEVAKLESLAKKDLEDLQKKFNLPNLDPKAMSTQIFMGEVEKNLGSVRKYVELARKYMPPKKSKEEKEKERAEMILPRERGKGQNFSFPITKGYPLFWLKKAAISSELNQSEWAGKISGTLTHVTSDPPLIGQPLKLDLKGDFPKQNIAGVNLLVTIDHTTDKAKESLLASVGQFPILEKSLYESEAFDLGIAKAQGKARLEAKLADDQLSLELKSLFREPGFSIRASKPKLETLVKESIKGIDSVSLDASVRGTFQSLSIDIDSDLGRKLADGFTGVIKGKVAEARAKIQGVVDSQLGPAKKSVGQELNAFNGQEKGLQEKAKQLLASIKKLQDSAKGGGGGSLQDKGKALFKGLGF